MIRDTVPLLCFQPASQEIFSFSKLGEKAPIYVKSCSIPIDQNFLSRKYPAQLDKMHQRPSLFARVGGTDLDGSILALLRAEIEIPPDYLWLM